MAAKPYLHPLCPLPRLVTSLLALHIHLDPRFLILELLIIFSVIRTFISSLTFTSSLAIVTLANGSQTIAKDISSPCPLPSLPLTFVLYIPDSHFNFISISKLTRNFNCLVTFSTNLVTL